VQFTKYCDAIMRGRPIEIPLDRFPKGLIPLFYNRRSQCGRARVEYDPLWSPSRPWLTFRNGTALQQFSSCQAAEAYLSEQGYFFNRAKPCRQKMDFQAAGA